MPWTSRAVLPLVFAYTAPFPSICRRRWNVCGLQMWRFGHNMGSKCSEQVIFRGFCLLDKPRRPHDIYSENNFYLNTSEFCPHSMLFLPSSGCLDAQQSTTDRTVRTQVQGGWKTHQLCSGQGSPGLHRGHPCTDRSQNGTEQRWEGSLLTSTQVITEEKSLLASVNQTCHTQAQVA